MQTSRMVTFFSAVIISYLLTDCVIGKTVQNKMTPTNIFKIKKGISIVDDFGIVLITQGYQKKRKWSKTHLKI
jgi:hypothetical protein